jgi:hypothetical protein
MYQRLDGHRAQGAHCRVREAGGKSKPRNESCVPRRGIPAIHAVCLA